LNFDEQDILSIDQESTRKCYDNQYTCAFT